MLTSSKKFWHYNCLQYFALSCAYQSGSFPWCRLQAPCNGLKGWIHNVCFWYILLFLNLYKGCLSCLTVSATWSSRSVGFLVDKTTHYWLCNFYSANSPPSLHLFNLRKEVKKNRNAVYNVLALSWYSFSNPLNIKWNITMVSSSS